MSPSSSRHRKRSGGSSRRRWLPWAVGGVGVILLANIAVALPGLLGGGEPSGFLTPTMLRWVLLWAPVTVAVAAVVTGLLWTSRALSRNDKSAPRWQRRGYVVALLGLVLLVAMRMDPVHFGAEGRTELAILVLAVVLALFAWSSRADATSGTAKRKRSGSRRDPPSGEPKEPDR